MQTEEFSEYAKFRNGVEAISSLLRRRYHVDKQYIKDTFKCIADCDMRGPERKRRNSKVRVRQDSIYQKKRHLNDVLF